MRTLLHELRPAGLVDTPLNVLLQHLVETVTSQTGVKISLVVGEPRSLPPDVQIALYRIAQETLNNAAKHAHATHVKVHLACNGNIVELHIVDDGRGFDPQNIPPDHFGIGIMRERAESIGTTLKITSTIGKGTETVILWSDDLAKGLSHESIKSHPRPPR
jgi:signal transduction histidine kinase